MTKRAKGTLALILAFVVLANAGIFWKMSYSKMHTSGDTIVVRVGDTVAANHPISQALFSLPIIAPTYNDLPQGYMSGVYTQQPIAAVNKSGFQDTKRWQFEGNAKLEYDFGSIKALEGLKAAVHVAYD